MTRGWIRSCSGLSARRSPGWWLDRDQPARAVDEARHLLTGYDSVSRLTRRENEDLPALALAAALGLIDFFLTEHDLVEESWLRTAHWIDDNFGALRLPASALGGRTSGRDR
jgi:Ser/Thr protein kinase RdoA (MazF antagonist)